MKKNRPKEGNLISRVKRLIIIIKLSAFLIFSGSITVSASIYTQATKLTLDLTGVSILEVLEQIEAQSEYVFIYKNEVIDLKKKVDVNVEGSTVDLILDKILKDSGIKYEIIKKQIILTHDNSFPAKLLKPAKENSDQPTKNTSKKM